MKNRHELENEIETRNATIDRIDALCTDTKEKEQTAQTTLSNLKKQLAKALARYALGETDHSGPEILKAQIAKAQTIIDDAPFIFEGLKSIAADISVETRKLQKQLSLIKAQESFDEAKAAIIDKANAGIVFGSIEGRFRQNANEIGVDVNNFVREMNKVRESKALCQPVNAECQPCPK